jgi:2-oxoglutarate ferredoxin oxidoreductase subunit beta
MGEIMDTATTAPAYDRKDFQSDQTIRWCPGCGDFSILAQLQRVMPDICAEQGIRRENVVFISGIGCSSRFPYYMNAFGFHTIHGRALTIATGLAVARPDLHIWVITGDGDALSIGGNHFIHTMRRNINLRVLLFNNRIYGLTKGQYSPTSEKGTKTKSSPMGSIEEPINPLFTALSCGATFGARAIDTDANHLKYVLKRAAAHRGTAFVEIFQNCNVFNDGTFAYFTDRDKIAGRTLYLEHGKPMLFGKDKDKTLQIRLGAHGVEPVVVDVADVSEKEIVVFREDRQPNYLSRFLSQMNDREFPVPLGVYRAVSEPCYEDQLTEQVERAIERRGRGDFMEHLHHGDTWEV